MARRSNPALSTAKQEPSNERIFTAPLRLWQGRAMSRWFRFHADAMRNPKVGRLSDKEFRLWVELLSVAAENDGLIPCLSDLKHVLKRRLDHLSTGVKQLISVGLIDALEVGYEPHNWSKFQYKSDVSTERVKRHREKRNVSETAPDTDTDTDTEEKEPKGSKKQNPSSIPDDWKPLEFGSKSQCCAIVASWSDDEMQSHIEHFTAHHRARGTKFKDWQGAWSTWVLNSDKFGRKANGNGNRKANGKSIDGRSSLARAIDEGLDWIDRAQASVS